MINFRTIYRILKYLENAMDYDEPDVDCISADHLKITENRWVCIMVMLVRSGYIAGIGISRGMDGEYQISVSDLRITLKGLEYLNENSMMQKAEKTAQEIIP